MVPVTKKILFQLNYFSLGAKDFPLLRIGQPGSAVISAFQSGSFPWLRRLVASDWSCTPTLPTCVHVVCRDILISQLKYFHLQE